MALDATNEGVQEIKQCEYLRVFASRPSYQVVRSSSDPSVHASIRLLGSMSHLTYVHLSLPFVYPLVFLCLCVCLPKLMPSYLLILVCLLNRLCIPQFRCAWSLYALNVIRMFVCHLSNQPASFSPMGLRNLKA